MLRHLAAQRPSGRLATTRRILTYTSAKTARATLSTSSVGTPETNPQEIAQIEQDTPELSTTPSWSLKALLQPPETSDTSSSTTTPPPTLDHILKLARLEKPSDPIQVAKWERDLERMAMFLNHIRTMARTTDDEYTAASPNSKEVNWASVPNLISLVDDGSGLQTRPAPSDQDNRGAGASAASGHKKKLSQQDEQELAIQRQVLLERAKHTKGNFFVVQTSNKPEDQDG
ncbi:hypothetical protein BGW42_000974 [Actinomortierella wolfii]|nr:hypothetical protein BGW42_000974 [Actinomortierella wolfii]